MMKLFYHIKNLQSTKTIVNASGAVNCFITLRIYKVLKPYPVCVLIPKVLSH